ncbi:MAG: hypothetical protein ACFB0A_14135 [Croceivirga sp.]|mgnify:FL=1
MKRVSLLLCISLYALMFSCSEESVEDILFKNEEQNTNPDSASETSDENDDSNDESNDNTADGENDTEENEDADDTTSGTEIILEASPDIIINDGQGPQPWGEGVTLEAFKIDGSPAQLLFDTQFQDKGFGVAGARWHQIDYYVMYQGEEVNASEKVVISFDGMVEDVVLTIGMLGLNEGVGDDDETGKWTAYNSSNEKVAEGVFGPDESDLGAENKLGGYGQYPFSLTKNTPFSKIEIEATGFGYGQGDPKNVNSYNNESGNKENNSDFNIMAISFKKL